MANSTKRVGISARLEMGGSLEHRRSLTHGGEWRGGGPEDLHLAKIRHVGVVWRSLHVTLLVGIRPIDDK